MSLISVEDEYKNRFNVGDIATLLPSDKALIELKKYKEKIEEVLVDDRRVRNACKEDYMSILDGLITDYDMDGNQHIKYVGRKFKITSINKDTNNPFAYDVTAELDTDERVILYIFIAALEYNNYKVDLL